ncbi:hypothetical protein ACO1J6_18390 [Leptospira interrogans serovar Hebdomadis]|uniref:hypothetical protein n=1 Tax=Leptospira interrogans TaxID=173 RepID=UPI0007733A28|nr:hypothetical protein [Leptospira interrogans]OQM28412.1 hypothetical protein DV38_15815 [Leptospira interrogans]
MIKAAKKENNKVAFFLLQKARGSIIKFASYLDRKIKLLGTLQLFVKFTSILTLSLTFSNFFLIIKSCFLQVEFLWELPRKFLFLNTLNLWARP